MLLFYISVEGNWGPWGSWGACSASCAGGDQSRTRTCFDSRFCSGTETNSQNCNNVPCPSKYKIFIFVSCQSGPKINDGSDICFRVNKRIFAAFSVGNSAESHLVSWFQRLFLFSKQNIIWNYFKLKQESYKIRCMKILYYEAKYGFNCQNFNNINCKHKTIAHSVLKSS